MDIYFCELIYIQLEYLQVLRGKYILILNYENIVLEAFQGIEDNKMGEKHQSSISFIIYQ